MKRKNNIGKLIHCEQTQLRGTGHLEKALKGETFMVAEMAEGSGMKKKQQNIYFPSETNRTFVGGVCMI